MRICRIDVGGGDGEVREAGLLAQSGPTELRSFCSS